MTEVRMDSKDKAANETRVLPTVVADAERAPAETDGARATRRPSKPLIAALAACCLALVVFSLGFVQPAPDGSWSLAWMLPGAGTNGVAAGSGESSARQDSVQDGDDAPAAGEDPEQQASDGDAGQDASPASSDSDTGTSAPGGAGPVAGGSQGGGAASGGASSAGGGSQGTDAAPDTMTITVSVSSSAAGGSVSGGGTFTFERGATAYDALAACGLAIGSDWGPMGIYVYSIGGLAEKQFDGAGGWMYSVNGSEPGYASSSYELSDGDSVSWYYVI